MESAPLRSYLVIALCCLTFAVVATILNLQKGAWYDEIWSLAMIRHDLPLGEIVRTRWLADIHPPWFYFTGWLASGVIGDSIQVARVGNVLFVLAAIGAGVGIARRYPATLPFLLPFTLALLGAQPLMKLTEEFRASVLIVAANAVLMISFYTIFASARDYRREDRVMALGIVFAACLSLNLHYVASIVGGLVIGVFVFALWFAGYRKWAVVVLASGAVAVLILLIWFVTQHQLFASTVTTFWAKTRSFAAIEMVARFLGMLAIANLVVTGLAVRRLVRSVRHGGPALAAWPFAMACGVIVIVGLVGLLLLNYERPFLQPRYLIALVPVAAAGVAAVAADSRWSPRTCWIAFGALLLSLGLNAVLAKMPLGWDVSARVVARYVAACRDTAVHVRPYWQVNPATPQQLATEPPIVRYGYLREATAHGFTIEPAASARISAKCPTIIWMAHVSDVSTTDAIQRSGLPIPLSAAATSRNVQFRNQQVIVVPPDAVRH